MAVVNTNISASLAQAALAKNERMLSKAMEQLSTGRKINTAADDAAGLAISTRMSSQIVGLEQSVQNAHDAISMIQTAESALDEMTTMLIRMRELALQASNGTGSSEDRDYLNDEFQRLKTEIDRIANNTEWNGRPVLNGNAGGTGVSDVIPSWGQCWANHLCELRNDDRWRRSHRLLRRDDRVRWSSAVRRQYCGNDNGGRTNLRFSGDDGYRQGYRKCQ